MVTGAQLRVARGDAIGALADYRQAEEFSHFGSELVAESKRALATGKRVLRVLTQPPSETFSLTAQQLMLDMILNLGDGEELDLKALKTRADEFAARIKTDDDYEKIRQELKAQCLIKLQNTPERQPAGAKK